MRAFKREREGRDINRRYYTLEQVGEEVKRPVVAKLLRMMELRNTHPAFNGEMHLLDSDPYTLAVRWENGREWAELHTDLKSKVSRITYTEDGNEKEFC